MRHPPLAPGWIDRPHRCQPLGDFVLESGATLRDAFVSYVVHGDPGRLRDAVILVTSAIGSTHHRLDFLIGPGAPLDTNRHCIVAVDALGNGLSISPSNSAMQPGPMFPRFAIRDTVESQRRLLDHLGAGRLFAVVGASMGGMQALQWAVSYPQRMERVIAMTPMARTSRWSQLVNELSRRALFSDAECRVPRPRDDAMRLWVPLTQLLTPRTPEALQAFGTHEALLQWLDERSLGLSEHGPDAYDWCYQSWAYDAHDVGTTPGWGGDTMGALGAVRAAVLVLGPALDLYNPAFAAREATAAIPGARFVELPGSEGHHSASGVADRPTAALGAAIASFLREPIG